MYCMWTGAFWVIETNYVYALIYGCSEQRDDGACDVNAEFAYVISRHASVPAPLLRRVDYILRRRLCIDTTRLQFTQHTRVYPICLKLKQIWSLYASILYHQSELVGNAAVPMSVRHVVLFCALRSPDARPRLNWRRSSSTVLSQVCLGRPGRRLQFLGVGDMQACRALEWSWVVRPGHVAKQLQASGPHSIW